MPIEESSAAIVLRARDYSESDRIVTLLTRDFGKLSGIAKGAKASRRRFERKLEPFSHVMLYFRRRPNGQLVFITRAEASPDLTPFAIEDDLDENRARQLHARTRRRVHLRRGRGDRRVSRARPRRSKRSAPGARPSRCGRPTSCGCCIGRDTDSTSRDAASAPMASRNRPTSSSREAAWCARDAARRFPTAR